MAALASENSKGDHNTVLFTDPSSLGTNGYYSTTGDVDDVACIIYMSQKLGEKLTVVICDDAEEGNRYSSFMDHLGQLLTAKYNIRVIPEISFSLKIVPEETSIYIHAPIDDSTADVLNSSKANITSIFTQGDDSSVNFKSSTKAKQFLAAAAEAGINLNRFNTTETNFRIPYNFDFYNSLKTEVCKKVYDDYFTTVQRQGFGTALHLGFGTELCNRLYSDTGFEGGPGNGIKKYKVLIQELKSEGKLPELSGELLAAFEATVGHGECDESAMQNGKDLISLMNLYCHYDRLIVGGKLPNMGNLGEIEKRTSVDPRVAAAFDAVPYSTPLFDFAAAYFAIQGSVEKDVLMTKVEESLTELDLDTISGGRRRHRRKSRKNTKKKRKSKKGGRRKKRKTKKKRRTRRKR